MTIERLTLERQELAAELLKAKRRARKTDVAFAVAFVVCAAASFFIALRGHHVLWGCLQGGLSAAFGVHATIKAIKR